MLNIKKRLEREKFMKFTLKNIWENRKEFEEILLNHAIPMSQNFKNKLQSLNNYDDFWNKINSNFSFRSLKIYKDLKKIIEKRRYLDYITKEIEFLSAKVDEFYPKLIFMPLIGNKDIFVVYNHTKPFGQELHGLMDKYGNFITKLKFNHIGRMSEKLINVCAGGKWGYIDHNGKWFINPEFEGAGSFQNGLAEIYYNKKMFFINKNKSILKQNKTLKKQYHQNTMLME